MDTMDQEIKSYIAGQRQVMGLGRRKANLYPTETDFYLFLTDQLQSGELEKFLSHLKAHPEDQAVVVGARRLFSNMSEAEKESVPSDLLSKVRKQIPGKESLDCPYCHKAITPFKKPLSRQKMLNLLWLVAGVALFSLSFLIKQFFIQWVVLGALCFIKWMVDQKNTNTQILIYKALSEETSSKINRDAGI